MKSYTYDLANDDA